MEPPWTLLWQAHRTKSAPRVKVEEALYGIDISSVRAKWNHVGTKWNQSGTKAKSEGSPIRNRHFSNCRAIGTKWNQTGTKLFFKEALYGIAISARHAYSYYNTK